MKKVIRGIILTAGLLMLASCRPQNTAGPIEIPESRFTPTPIVVPTCTPTEGLIQTVIPSPTNTVTPVAELPTPTVVEEPVLKPTAAPTPEPSPMPTLTVTPTAEPTPTEVVTATPEPSPLPTETPVPTEAEPSPTPEPTATPTPLPTATPTPTVNPEPLVTNGWQKMVSFDEKYVVVFPDIFRDSSLAKTQKKLRIGYTSPEDEAIEFVISYMMNRTLENSMEEILQEGGIVIEHIAEEKRISYLLYKDGIVYQGILLEEEYGKELLGSAFGDDDIVKGVMNVMFSYPEERKGEYQTEQYSYYVVKNREGN